MSENKPKSPFYEIIAKYQNTARIGDGFVDADGQRFTVKNGVVVSDKLVGYSGRQTSRGIENYMAKVLPKQVPAVKETYVSLDAD
jgi:hypothetical protein